MEKISPGVSLIDGLRPPGRLTLLRVTGTWYVWINFQPSRISSSRVKELCSIEQIENECCRITTFHVAHSNHLREMIKLCNSSVIRYSEWAEILNRLQQWIDRDIIVIHKVCQQTVDNDNISLGGLESRCGGRNPKDFSILTRSYCLSRFWERANKI